MKQEDGKGLKKAKHAQNNILSLISLFPAASKV
jgi:hypothetical protein